MTSTPEYLYKYRPFNAYALSCIANHSIWLAKPESFNDPFDCAITLDKSLYKDSIIHAISASMNTSASIKREKEKLFTLWPGDVEAFETLRNSIKELTQNMGICSFAESPDTLLLWSHYADHHRGFCVEYNSKNNKLSKLAQKVRYTDSVPKISAADLDGPNKHDAFDSLWLTKATCWSYEKEWRVMDKEGDKEVQAPAPISAIIFGAKMPIKDRVTIINILNYDETIIFKEAVLADGAFNLELKSYYYRTNST